MNRIRNLLIINESKKMRIKPAANALNRSEEQLLEELADFIATRYPEALSQVEEELSRSPSPAAIEPNISSPSSRDSSPASSPLSPESRSEDISESPGSPIGTAAVYPAPATPVATEEKGFIYPPRSGEEGLSLRDKQKPATTKVEGGKGPLDFAKKDISLRER